MVVKKKESQHNYANDNLHHQNTECIQKLLHSSASLHHLEVIAITFPACAHIHMNINLSHQTESLLPI